MQGNKPLGYMSYIGMGSLKGFGLSAVLVINRVWFMHPSLELVMVLKEASFSSLLIRPSRKLEKVPDINP